MKRKVAEIYLDEDEDGEMLLIEWEDDLMLTQRLGVLEWGKAIELEAVKMDNALRAYSEDET